MRKLRYIFCVIILLAGSTYSYAQYDNLTMASNCMERGSIDSAKTFINKALTEPVNKNNALAWLLKGFIYKDLYKKYEVNLLVSSLRDTAVNDLFLSYRLDSITKENKENITGGLNYLAATYHNNAVSIMDSVNFHQALFLYNRFKYIMKKIKPGQNFNALDIEFYDALGTIYSGFFQKVTVFDIKRKYLDSARKAYDAVLAIYPDDYPAVYGIATLYYNQAVNIENDLPFEAPIETVNKAQDSCVHLAKISLPFFLKAHALKPLKIEPVKGLQGDYFLLHEEDDFKIYKEMEEKLNQQQVPKK